LLFSPYTVVVYASGFEEAQAVQGGEFQNPLCSFPVITGLENVLGSIMEVVNPELLSPFFSFGEVL
jgi:hypothetical protein